MIEFQAVDHLLTQAQQVVEHHEKTLRVSGNGFSFIHALDLERDEARFHTRFIGYLLHPKAGHFQGEKFLQLFFKAVGISEATDGFTVEMEKHIGKRDWDNVEGGRIDLLISNTAKKIAFAIEVKIHALEQLNQLERYRNFVEKYFDKEKSKVYYLTLEGDSSKFNFSKYERISFKDHLFKWIESCRIASIDQPIIRETFTQYIANIKRLTKQNPDDQMSDEIIKLIIKSDASFKAFVALASSESRLYNKFGEALIKSIEESTDLGQSFDIKFNNQSIPITDAEISFFLKGSNIERVRIYWLGKNIVGIGMHIDSTPDYQLRVALKSKLSELKLGKYLDYSNWVWLSEIEELKGQPQLSFDSWEKFNSAEFAKKVAIWVKHIADAYKAVKNENQL